MLLEWLQAIFDMVNGFTNALTKFYIYNHISMLHLIIYSILISVGISMVFMTLRLSDGAIRSQSYSAMNKHVRQRLKVRKENK